MLITAAATIFVLGVLIFIHELGHFLMAKKVGIKVEKFSLGFPPNIFAKKYGETTYCIGIIPLGGYVKMAGENPDEETTGAEHEFMSKTVGQRAAVIFAGPFMNYILAIVLMISIFLFSGYPVFDQEKVVVGEITPDKPAAAAGLLTDDIIIGVNGETVANFDSLRTRINSFVNEEITVTWIRGDDTITTPITTYAGQILNEEGKIDSIGLIGFSQKPLYYESIGFFEAVKEGFVRTHYIVLGTVSFVKKLVTREVSMKLVGGPVFIAQQAGVEAKRGGASLFGFMALLSINLAVLNVLPIPVLDGGHLVFLLIEKIKGGPIPMKARIIAQQVGIVLLLSLIGYVMYNDFLRVF